MSHFTDELKTLLARFESSVLGYLSPAARYIEQNGGTLLLTLAEDLLKGFVAGTPWGVLIADLEAEAVKRGITLAENAAAVALGSAQANLIATGEIAAPEKWTPRPDPVETFPADSVPPAA